MSLFDSPNRGFSPSRGFRNTDPLAASGGFGSTPFSQSSSQYPDLPAELQTPLRPVTPYGRNPAAPGTPYFTPKPAPAPARSIRPQPRTTPPRANAGTIVPANTRQAIVERPVDNLLPIPRAARTINENLAKESRYPDLDSLIGQGQSADYDMPAATAWAPFKRTASYQIPDAVYDQYNQTEVHTMMGLFAEIGQAWLTVDNKLYIWDFVTGTNFQSYEALSHNITGVKLLRPRQDVFVPVINYILVIATTTEIALLAVSANLKKETGQHDITLFETKMSVPTKGLDVSVIDGSAETGRIFFGGRTDNDLYEFTYQESEGWFSGRTGKICHTSQTLAAFAPRLPFFGPRDDTEFLSQIVVDDSRSLLYTLSSKSTIRVFHLHDGKNLSLKITHHLPATFSNIRAMIPTSPLLNSSTSIVSISPLPKQEARRTHFIAITSTGVRLYFSASSNEWSGDGIPTTLQVTHVRFPPDTEHSNGQVEFGQNARVYNDSKVLTPTRRAEVFPPGFFFCITASNDVFDTLFICAPDSAKISVATESGQNRLSYPETGCFMSLESKVETIQLLTPPFKAAETPSGFGNETAVQFDQRPTEVAILTNNGIHVYQRRRLVDVFVAAIQYGATSSPVGIDGEIRTFYEQYGRNELCATALAVACDETVETTMGNRARIQDEEVLEQARRFFIEYGGKPRVDDVYESAITPSLDNVKLSGRHDGIALYLERIVRSIWKSHIIVVSTDPVTKAPVYSSEIDIEKLRVIQKQLVNLQKFLNANKSFIEGLSDSEGLMRAVSRVEEIAQQAEHRGLYAMVQLLNSMIEGISFVLVLIEDNLGDVMAVLPEAERAKVPQLTFQELFSMPSGQMLAKELVTAIVNKSIATGTGVDIVAGALRRRCGSFCSADDVVIFKALEALRRAKVEQDVEVRNRLLDESLKLFEKTAATLGMEYLKETVGDYNKLNYFTGSVILALSVAKESDKQNVAMAYIDAGKVEGDSRKSKYDFRIECYKLVFETLQLVDTLASKAPEPPLGEEPREVGLKADTWKLVLECDDGVLHNALYDWLFEAGRGQQLLDINSPFVLDYLSRSAIESITHADLLWQYYGRREQYYDAASVLYTLAQCINFKLTLERRLEYLSRAKGYCNSYGPMAARQKMNELGHTVQEELDVAVIQDDVLRRIKEDTRINPEKKEALVAQLDDHLLTLSDLFNRYAEPYGYHDVCLQIFQSADFRGLNEIRKTWELLINQTHEKTINAEDISPYEAVADTVRRLGHRFALSEHIFPPPVIIPLLENYALEYVQNAPSTWVVDTLLDAGFKHEVILRVLEEMFRRDELPFHGTARRRLVRDAIYVGEKWLAAEGRRGGFKPEVVDFLEDLQREASSKGCWDMDLTNRLTRMKGEVRRRGF